MRTRVQLNVSHQKGHFKLQITPSVCVVVPTTGILSTSTGPIVLLPASRRGAWYFVLLGWYWICHCNNNNSTAVGSSVVRRGMFVVKIMVPCFSSYVCSLCMYTLPWREGGRGGSMQVKNARRQILLQHVRVKPSLDYNSIINHE